MLTFASKPEFVKRPASAPWKAAISFSSLSATCEFPSKSLDPVEPNGVRILFKAPRKSSWKSLLVDKDKKSFDEKSTDPGRLDFKVRSFD